MWRPVLARLATHIKRHERQDRRAVGQRNHSLNGARGTAVIAFVQVEPPGAGMYHEETLAQIDLGRLDHPLARVDEPRPQAAHQKRAGQDVDAPRDGLLVQRHRAAQLGEIEHAAVQVRQHRPKPPQTFGREGDAKTCRVATQKALDEILPPGAAGRLIRLACSRRWPACPGCREPGLAALGSTRAPGLPTRTRRSSLVWLVAPSDDLPTVSLSRGVIG